jgi:hypothetical protein
MASEKQIAANRANAKRSTGPSEAARERTRFNAVKHGLASELVDVEAAASDAFADRKQKWGAIYRPADEPGEWALDQAVAASIRIEKCGRTIERLSSVEQVRASVAWDQDRAVEAATIFGRLAKDPVLVARQLETTLHGVRLLIDAWFGLAEPLEAGRDWSDDEASKALDLLGVALDRRSGRTPIAAPEGIESLAFRQAVTLDEIERLEAVRDEVMAPLDEMNRQIAIEGDLALLSKPAQLAMRYEREAWKRYREAMKVLQSPTPAPIPVAPVPPVVAARPQPSDRERNEANSFREERRLLLDQASAILASYTGLPRPTDEAEEAEWLEEAERRLHAPATERSQFRAVSVGQK